MSIAESSKSPENRESQIEAPLLTPVKDFHNYSLIRQKEPFRFFASRSKVEAQLSQIDLDLVMGSIDVYKRRHVDMVDHLKLETRGSEIYHI